MIEKFEALQKNNCFWKCIFSFLSWSRKSLNDVHLILAPIIWQGHVFLFLPWQHEVEAEMKLRGNFFRAFPCIQRHAKSGHLLAFRSVTLFAWSETQLSCPATSALNAFCPDWLIERHELKAKDMFITSIMLHWFWLRDQTREYLKSSSAS